MGIALLIKGADFSQNAVDTTDLYDLVKQTDVATPEYPASNQFWYNTVALNQNAMIYQIEFTVPSDISNLTKSKGSIIRLGVTTDGQTALREYDVDISFIINKVIDGEIQPGTTHRVSLQTPYRVNVGEYIGAFPGPSSYNRSFCYARNPSGNLGYMERLGDDHASNYNLALNFYGEILNS